MARTRESLERELAIRRANLDRLEEQKAQFGIRAPTDLLNEIDNIKERIVQIEEQLRHTPPEPSPSESIAPHGWWEILLKTPRWKIYAGCMAVVVALVIAGVLAIPSIGALGRQYLARLRPPTPTSTPTKTPVIVLSPTITGTPTLTSMPSPTPTPTPYYVEIVVDASERMSAQFEGGLTKIQSAWQTAGTIARTRAQRGQFVSIRTFGSGGEQMAMDCFESCSVLSFTNQDSEVKAHLMTPPIPGGQAAVATALTDASAELMAYENIGREIILLTGGDDECGSALLAFYESENRALWTQTFVVLFADQDFGPFIALRTKGANIHYDLVKNRVEAETVAEKVAVAAPVLIAMVPTPTSPPPSPTTGGETRPTSTQATPPPTRGTATATRPPTPTATQSPTPTSTPTSTPTATRTPTSTPTPTHTPTAPPTPMPLPLDDPSFESSGIITPPWWHWGWPPSDDGGTRDPDATDCVHSGNQALKITRVTTASVWAGNVVMQEVPFNAGQILRFHTWLKILELSKGEAYVELIFATDDNTELKKCTGDKYRSPSQDWTQIGVQGIAPEGTTKAKLFLVVGYEPEGTGVVCFDDISAFVQQ